MAAAATPRGEPATASQELVAVAGQASTTTTTVAVTQANRFWGHGHAEGRGPATMARAMAAPATPRGEPATASQKLVAVAGQASTTAKTVAAATASQRLVGVAVGDASGQTSPVQFRLPGGASQAGCEPSAAAQARSTPMATEAA